MPRSHRKGQSRGLRYHCAETARRPRASPHCRLNPAIVCSRSLTCRPGVHPSPQVSRPLAAQLSGKGTEGCQGFRLPCDRDDARTGENEEVRGERVRSGHGSRRWRSHSRAHAQPGMHAGWGPQPWGACPSKRDVGYVGDGKTRDCARARDLTAVLTPLPDDVMRIEALPAFARIEALPAFRLCALQKHQCASRSPEEGEDFEPPRRKMAAGPAETLATPSEAQRQTGAASKSQVLYCAPKPRIPNCELLISNCCIRTLTGYVQLRTLEDRAHGEKSHTEVRKGRSRRQYIHAYPHAIRVVGKVLALPACARPMCTALRTTVWLYAEPTCTISHGDADAVQQGHDRPEVRVPIKHQTQTAKFHSRITRNSQTRDGRYNAARSRTRKIS